jgi:hypothetical protein
MNIFFNKRTGTIKAVFSGNLQSIATVYGEESQDYAQIYGEATFPDDNLVIRNPENFKVNVEKNQLEILSDLNYPVSAL